MKKLRVLAIDPGTKKSAFVEIETGHGTPNAPKSKIVGFGILRNRSLAKNLTKHRGKFDILAIEKIAAMGMPASGEVMDTALWSGIFIRAWNGKFKRIPRMEVKVTICGTTRAKDPHIRAAMIDEYGPVRLKDKGEKKSRPGPTAGIADDEWQALAVARTWELNHSKKFLGDEC